MNKQKLIILTEGESDAAFLNRILPNEFKIELKIVVAQGYSSMVSLAKSILINNDASALLVLDADTNQKSVIDEKRRDMLFTFTSMGKRENVRIFFFIPVLENVFFENEAVRNKLFNQQEYSELMLGKSPSKIMKEKYRSTQNVITKLSQEDLDLLKQNHQVKALLNTIKEFFFN